MLMDMCVCVTYISKYIYLRFECSWILMCVYIYIYLHIFTFLILTKNKEQNCSFSKNKTVVFIHEGRPGRGVNKHLSPTWLSLCSLIHLVFLFLLLVNFTPRSAESTLPYLLAKPVLFLFPF